jgi:hypothetical protein
VQPPSCSVITTCAPPTATKGRYNSNSEDVDVNLDFFSAFDDLHPQPLAPWRRTGLGSCHDEPLLSLLSDSNTTFTIPYKYAPRQKQAFEFGCADGVSQGSRRGSHVYEINTLMWNVGRPQPRISELSVAKAEGIRRKPKSEASWRANETPDRPGSVQLKRNSPAEWI